MNSPARYLQCGELLHDHYKKNANALGNGVLLVSLHNFSNHLKD